MGAVLWCLAFGLAVKLQAELAFPPSTHLGGPSSRLLPGPWRVLAAWWGLLPHPQRGQLTGGPPGEEAAQTRTPAKKRARVGAKDRAASQTSVRKASQEDGAGPGKTPGGCGRPGRSVPGFWLVWSSTGVRHPHPCCVRGPDLGGLAQGSAWCCHCWGMGTAKEVPSSFWGAPSPLEAQRLVWTPPCPPAQTPSLFLLFLSESFPFLVLDGHCAAWVTSSGWMGQGGGGRPHGSHTSEGWC